MKKNFSKSFFTFMLVFVLIFANVLATTAIAASNDLDSFAEYSLDKPNVNSIDWSTAVTVSNFEEYNAYINRCLENGLTTIAVKCINGYIPYTNFSDVYNVPAARAAYLQQGDEYCIVYNIMHFPGTRVALAYLNNDKRGLTGRELQLYNKAVNFINKLDTSKPKLYQELEIYDFICNSTTYFTNNSYLNKTPEFCSAIGVFLNKKANCQGYTDAFYMLARMAGFQVGRISGKADGADHTWNTIRLNSKWYMVDATWGDEAFNSDTSYTYFNASKTLMALTHRWYDDTIKYKNVSDTLDKNYLFYSSYAKANNLYVFNDANTIYSDAAKILISSNKPIQIFAENIQLTGKVGQNIGDAIQRDFNSSSSIDSAMEYKRNIGTFLYLKKS